MSLRQGIYWYVGFGLALGVVVLPMVLFRKRKSTLADSMIDALYPERKTAWYRFRERVLLPLLILPLMGLIWPILIVLIGQDFWQNRHKRDAALREEPPELTAKDLVDAVSINDVESSERVIDPLGAVPDLPFGHLNAAWQTFMAKRQPNETLWRYEATYSPDWGGSQTRRGYVWVRDRKIGAFFRTYRRPHPRE